jgi:protein-S-isoprenylcysteine O-methyltransferase Ste14
MIFDPFQMAGRHLGEERLHRLIRAFMVLVLAAFLIHRVSQYRLFAVKALWLAETALFSVLILAFLLRTNPVNRSRGAAEIIIPLVGSALPFSLLLSPPAPFVTGNRALFFSLLWGMALATLLTVSGMWTLRRSFSITVEARVLVTGGPYRLIRHPIYSGEILAAVAVAAIRFSPANLGIILLFIAIQLYRSRLEEQKLAATFPEYREFAGRSFWFW